jgi:hypothetical protein
MIVKADYIHGDPTKFPKPRDPPPPESAVAPKTKHLAPVTQIVFTDTDRIMRNLDTG